MVFLMTDFSGILKETNSLQTALHTQYRKVADATKNSFGLAVFTSARDYIPEYEEQMLQLEGCLGKLLKQATVGHVVTGGGPAGMVRANKVAAEHGAPSYRVSLPIPNEETAVDFSTIDLPCTSLDERVSIMDALSDVVLCHTQGGYGTLYEAMRIASRAQLQRKFYAASVPYLFRHELRGLITPVVFVGSLYDQTKEQLVEMARKETLWDGDLDLCLFARNYDEAYEIILEARTRWNDAQIIQRAA
jgi:predicted Rossmann-fold nucleotide-binding protein